MICRFPATHSLSPTRPSRITTRCPRDDASGIPPFAYWRGYGAKALLTGKLTWAKDGRLKVKARLWDVARGQLLSGQQYFVEPEHRSQLAHIIADTIYTRLTGRDGHFEADNPK